MNRSTHALVLCLLVFVGSDLRGASSDAAGTPPARGIVLILVDTLRADHLGCYGYDRKTSPALDEWIKKGALFENAYSTSPWTLPAVGSLLTGQWPSRHSAGRRIEGAEMKYAQLDESLPTLAEMLSASGFATGAIINNPFMEPKFKLDRGFDSYDHGTATNLVHRRADEVVDLSLQWVESHAAQPFFLLVHIFDPHMSYDAPDPVRGRFTSQVEGEFELPVRVISELRKRAPTMPMDERAFVSAAYDEEIAFVDIQLDRLMHGLQKLDGWDRLLVVLTSDHGEELFDHGGFEHGHTVYDELLRVPLLVWGPAIEARRERGAVSLVDLAPTLLAATGTEHPDDAFAGISLWPNLTSGAPLPRRSLIAEGTFRDAERKAILAWPLKLHLNEATGEQRLYDLSQDRAEMNDLVSTKKKDARRLKKELVRTVEAAARQAEQQEAPLDEETRKRLRSLGYVN